MGISDAGGGVEFDRGRIRFFLEGRYTWGLLEQSRERDEDPEESKLRNRGLRALLGVTARLGGQ